jgi:UDP-N-acetylmuramyl pentapeptide phosphotransferase/UDP-N-acetylglucosamine-1-phosphate transferase
MVFFGIALTAAAIIATALVLLAPLYLRAAADHDLSGPQKVHTRPVPRIGGVAVVGAALVGAASALVMLPAESGRMWLLLACAVPVVGFGFLEDFTKAVSPSQRMTATLVSAALSMWWLQAVITRTGIVGFDELMHLPLFAIALTLLIVAGVVNAINIIDGFNGLASMCAALMFAALAWVAHSVGDTFILTMALVMLGATLGFFLLNYPAGLIFLGDGGAYFLGFMVATLGILLVNANPGVSPLFPVLLAAYPLFETMFSIYRRKMVRGRSSTDPDGIHLHTLIYRRVIRHVLPDDHSDAMRKVARNSMTSPYLWLLCLSTVIPAVAFWDRTMVLGAVLLAFMALYVLLYWAIVRFKVPGWLVLRRRQGYQARHPARGTSLRTSWGSGAGAAAGPEFRPRVTVVTVGGDDAARLAQTLRSVAQQTYSAIEHIVVSQGSLDEGCQRALLLGREGSLKTALVDSQSPLAVALNRGMASATGDLIGFLDAGSVFTSSRSVEQLVAAAKASRSDMVYSDMAFYRSRPGGHGRKLRDWRAGEFSASSLRYGWRPPRAATWYKRSLLQWVGDFDPSMRNAMDHDYALRCFAIEGRRPAYVPSVLVAGPERPPLHRVLRTAPARMGDELRALQRSRVGGLWVVALIVARRGLRGLRSGGLARGLQEKVR